MFRIITGVACMSYGTLKLINDGSQIPDWVILAFGILALATALANSKKKKRSGIHSSGGGTDQSTNSSDFSSGGGGD